MDQTCPLYQLSSHYEGSSFTASEVVEETQGLLLHHKAVALPADSASSGLAVDRANWGGHSLPTPFFHHVEHSVAVPGSLGVDPSLVCSSEPNSVGPVSLHQTTDHRVPRQLAGKANTLETDNTLVLLASRKDLESYNSCSAASMVDRGSDRTRTASSSSSDFATEETSVVVKSSATMGFKPNRPGKQEDTGRIPAICMNPMLRKQNHEARPPSPVSTDEGVATGEVSSTSSETSVTLPEFDTVVEEGDNVASYQSVIPCRNLTDAFEQMYVGRKSPGEVQTHRSVVSDGRNTRGDKRHLRVEAIDTEDSKQASENTSTSLISPTGVDQLALEEASQTKGHGRLLQTVSSAEDEHSKVTAFSVALCDGAVCDNETNTKPHQTERYPLHRRIDKELVVTPADNTDNSKEEVSSDSRLVIPHFPLHESLMIDLSQPVVNRVSFYSIVHDINKEANGAVSNDNASCQASSLSGMDTDRVDSSEGEECGSLIQTVTGTKTMDCRKAGKGSKSEGAKNPEVDEESWLLSVIASRPPDEIEEKACPPTFAEAIGEQEPASVETGTTSAQSANPLSSLASSRTQLWKPSRSWWEAKSGKNPWIEPVSHNKRWRYLWPLIHYHKFIARCIKKLKRSGVDVKTSTSPVSSFLREEVCAVSDHLAAASKFTAEEWVAALAHFEGWIEQDRDAQERLKSLIATLSLKGDCGQDPEVVGRQKEQIEHYFHRAIASAREQMENGAFQHQNTRNTSSGNPSRPTHLRQPSGDSQTLSTISNPMMGPAYPHGSYEYGRVFNPGMPPGFYPQMDPCSPLSNGGLSWTQQRQNKKAGGRMRGSRQRAGNKESDANGLLPLPYFVDPRMVPVAYSQGFYPGYGGGLGGTPYFQPNPHMGMGAPVAMAYPNGPFFPPPGQLGDHPTQVAPGVFQGGVGPVWGFETQMGDESAVGARCSGGEEQKQASSPSELNNQPSEVDGANVLSGKNNNGCHPITNSSHVPNTPFKYSEASGMDAAAPLSPYWGHLDQATLAMTGLATPQGGMPPTPSFPRGGVSSGKEERFPEAENSGRPPRSSRRRASKAAQFAAQNANPLLINPSRNSFGQSTANGFAPPSPATQFLMSPQASWQAAAYMAGGGQREMSESLFESPKRAKGRSGPRSTEEDKMNAKSRLEKKSNAGNPQMGAARPDQKRIDDSCSLEVTPPPPVRKMTGT